jgi:GNAT superfamily N-acetyltransferase
MTMNSIRRCGDDDVAAIVAIVNAAATVYRGAIPADCWHEPYMTMAQLRREITDGVSFWGCEREGELVGVMGAQPVRDVDLIRHAYVRPDCQRHGVGAALIEHILRQSARRMLVGTWEAATWAIAFYGRHGFELVAPERRRDVLRAYWTIPERQLETSVVLARPPLDSVLP